MPATGDIGRHEAVSRAPAATLAVGGFHFDLTAQHHHQLTRRRSMPILIQAGWQFDELHGRRGERRREAQVMTEFVLPFERERNVYVAKARSAVRACLHADELHEGTALL